MAEKLVSTGQIVLQDGTTNVMSFNASNVFGTLDNILEHEKGKRTLIDTDGAVTLSKGGVGTVRAFLLYIREGSGTVVMKHDGNANGIEIAEGILIVGNLDVVTVETDSTQALTIEYLFVE